MKRTRAITTYLSFVLSRIPDTNSTLCHWDGSWGKICTTFARQALSMNWDYIEVNEFSEKGYSFKILGKNIMKTFINLININSLSSTITTIKYL